MAIGSFIDSIAWIFARCMGLLMAITGEIVSAFINPNPCKKGEYDAFQQLNSLLYGGWMIFYSQSPSDMPETIRRRLLLIGKVIMGAFAYSIIEAITRELLK